MMENREEAAVARGTAVMRMIVDTEEAFFKVYLVVETECDY